MRYALRATAAVLVAACVSVSSPARSQPAELQVVPGELAAALVAAEEGSILHLSAGRYRGPITIDRTLAIIGEGEAVIEGDGSDTVITVDAAQVRVEGLTITGSGQNKPFASKVYWNSIISILRYSFKYIQSLQIITFTSKI